MLRCSVESELTREKRCVLIKSSRAISRVNKLKLAYISGSVSVAFIRATNVTVTNQPKELTKGGVLRRLTTSLDFPKWM
jgi:hypothetical protein